MTGPVVLMDRDGWLSVEWTITDVAAGVELTDAEDGEYVAVDATGRRVAIGVRRDPRGGDRWRGGEVVVEATDDLVDHDEVRCLLELALPEEQRVGDGPGSRSLIDCFTRLLHHPQADRVPRPATARLRVLLAGE